MLKRKFLTGTIHNIDDKIDRGQIYKKIFIKNNNKLIMKLKN